MTLQPVSMHAEMHAIFSLTGMSPSFKTQVQGMERRVPPATPPEARTKGSKGLAGPESHLSGPTESYEFVPEHIHSSHPFAWKL